MSKESKAPWFKPYKGMEVADIMDTAEVKESFVDAVIHVAEGNLSADEANISRIYNAVYQLGA